MRSLLRRLRRWRYRTRYTQPSWWPRSGPATMSEVWDANPGFLEATARDGLFPPFEPTLKRIDGPVPGRHTRATVPELIDAMNLVTVESVGETLEALMVRETCPRCQHPWREHDNNECRVAIGELPSCRVCRAPMEQLREVDGSGYARSGIPPTTWDAL